jgi:hypothetical protein
MYSYDTLEESIEYAEKYSKMTDLTVGIYYNGLKYGIEYKYPKSLEIKNYPGGYTLISSLHHKDEQNQKPTAEKIQEQIKNLNPYKVIAPQLPKIETDNHETDFYFKSTPETEKIISNLKKMGNIATKNIVPFKNQRDGKLWYDIPFAFIPEWERRLNERHLNNIFDKKIIYNNSFMNYITDYFSKSFKNNTSVLLKTHPATIDYSINADTGKPFAAIQQLYFQQQRFDNKWNNPYFASNKHLHNTIDKGVILGNFDKNKQKIALKFYYNIGDLYKINAQSPEKLYQKAFENHPGNSTDGNTIPSELQYNMTRYFHSIYTGYEYKPTKFLIKNQDIIAKEILSGNVSLPQIASQIHSDLDKLNKEHNQEKNTASLNDTENLVNTRTQGHKHGRSR